MADKTKLPAEGVKKEVRDQNRKQSRRRRRTLRFVRRRASQLGLVLFVLLAAFLVIKAVRDRWEYKDYKVTSSLNQEDTNSTNYMEMGDYLLKIGGGRASLLGDSGTSLWNQDYDMGNPTGDVNGTTAVIYDKEGTNMIMVGRKGLIGSVTTTLPIIKAKVASQGVVAAILEDGENTWVNFYSTNGQEIATGKTRVDSPGYPVDLSISSDGMLIMVSYMYVKDGKTTSYVAFYNFGNTGQTQMDNIVSGYTYEGTVVPQVKFLEDGKSVAFMDKGFAVYEGKQIPKLLKEVKVKKEIVSSFIGDSSIGMIFLNDQGEKENASKYTMEVYDLNGSRKFSSDFNIEYTKIKISRGVVILSNETQVCIFNMNGHKKFDQTLQEGKIHDVFHLHQKLYQLVVDGSIKTIKLK